jgi:Bacterial Ig-like domain (group 3)
VRISLPQKGCFKASYPNKEWQETACSTAKPFPVRPQAKGNMRGGLPATIGGGGATDFSAETSGVISTAEGSFNSVTSGITEASGPAGGTSGTQTNTFGLQLNTSYFTNSLTTMLCKNAGDPSVCQGWEQFVFQNNQPPPYCSACVSIEYWLYPYGGGTCPTGWTPDGGDCYISTSLTPVTPVTIADLANLTMTGTISGGNDTAIIGSSDLSAVGADNTLDLDQSWNVAEFNVFGNGGADEAYFSTSPGTTIVVKTSIDDGTTNAPSCLHYDYTGETNNLDLADLTATTTLVCCPYGGMSPAIEFMETNAGHTATCGPTALLGDPHITTIDGAHYDFQGAGEFVSLREPDGQDIQTRQKPVSTTFIGNDAYDGLTTCVSLNTAVAARVGGHRLTYEPNLSGVPDPSGLQLRIDGALASLGAQGMALGTGGRVVPQAGGALEVDFPDGKTLFVTPEWWASQSEWYLNVDVTHHGLVTGGGANSTGGIVGPIADGSWLPALPNGASMGPMPGGLQQRYDALYHKFADAWRVTNKDSLFDYAPGESTNTFTMKDWPSQRAPCTVPNKKPVEPASEAVAVAACRRVADKDRRANCVFDVRATGDPTFARGYLASQRNLADSTTTSLTDDADPSQAGEWVTFTAVVVANSSTTADRPSGTVQFAVDGSNVGEPIELNAKSRARWTTSRLKVGTHRVTASYVPSADSEFLPSTSLEKLQKVERCLCDTSLKR